jgi:putative colanic acid biosynthesis UDP-glucose lipid carrier transferase
MEPVSLLEPPHLQTAPLRARPVLAVHTSLASPLDHRSNKLLKRSIDLFLSTVLILAIFPWFLPIVALLIVLDSRGPVFFRQRRHKQGGQVFSCLKLRTMVVNDNSDILASFEGDKRITGVGRLLRRTHMDELPQLVNVWLGDMSLIGPRPHMISENESFASAVRDYPLRNLVKPGITGLAQVRGFVGATHDTDAIRMRVLHDLHYIQHWSPRLDTRIIYKTLLQLFRKPKQAAA